MRLYLCHSIDFIPSSSTDLRKVRVGILRLIHVGTTD